MMADDYADKICEELCGKRYGGKVMCHCPAHEDSKPSLCVSTDNGKLLVHCFAGCQQSEVIEALKEIGLWPLRGRRRTRRRGNVRKEVQRNLTVAEAKNVAFGLLPNGRYDDAVLKMIEDMKTELETYQLSQIDTSESYESIVDQQVDEMIEQDSIYRELGLDNLLMWRLSKCS